MSFSNAKYSAAVKAMRGVAIRSIAGSFAKLMKTTERSIAPVFLKSFIKNSASSYVIPTAAKTTANFSSEPTTLAWRAICAANCSCGRPDAENTGNF